MAVRKKSDYAFFSNLRFILAAVWKYSPGNTVAEIGAAPAAIALSLSGMLAGKLVLDAIAGGWSPGDYLVRLGLLSAFMVFAGWANGYCQNIGQGLSGMAYYHFTMAQYKKQMTLDYEQLEDPDVLQKLRLAKETLGGSQESALGIFYCFPKFLAGALGFFIYGGVISYLSPLILVLLFASAAINAAALRRVRRYTLSIMGPRSRNNVQMWNIMSWIQDIDYAQDIRLYTMGRWLQELIGRHMAKAKDYYYQIDLRQLGGHLIGGVLLLLRDGLAYGYLIHLFLAGAITLGEFSLTFAAIGSFSAQLSAFVVYGNQLLASTRQVSILRSFLDIPNRTRQSGGAPLPPAEAGAPVITFKDVSYTYPGAETPALSHISLTLRPGEKLALVGENGAGKTTLVKLLCGLYDPTQGEILVNGVNIRDFNRKAYYRLICAVFQNIDLLPLSLARNVSQSPEGATDRHRVRAVLEKADLWEKAASLPQGMDTPMVPSLTGGVNLSGGELQKLALARALYKSGPILVLDEPTAALDPIAEHETYLRYRDLARDKTALYVSHRLASTRFCDRILLLERGHLAQEGTHETLLKQHGPYARMFDLQKSYYNAPKGGVDHEAKA